MVNVLTASGERIAAKDDELRKIEVSTNSSGGECPECPVYHCPKKKTTTWSLTNHLNKKTQAGADKLYDLRLNIGKTSAVNVRVVLVNLFTEGERSGGYAKTRGAKNKVGNCFQFATRKSYGVPGGPGSPVDTIRTDCGIKDHCLAASMKMEDAVYLGKDFNSPPLGEGNMPDTSKPYYLIGAFMLTGNDYHFWGSFRDVGWACVPSQAASSTVMPLSLPQYRTYGQKFASYWGIEERCGTNLFTNINKALTTQYDPNLEHVGFYLFPCTSENGCDGSECTQENGCGVL